MNFISKKQYSESVNIQKDTLRNIAEKLDNRAALSDVERHFLSGMCRSLVKKMSDEPVYLKRGAPSKICRNTIFIKYFSYFNDGDTKEKHTKTVEKIALELGITKQAIFKIINENKAEFENIRQFYSRAKIGR